MIDMSKTIIAKSDQLNADDLIGRAITIKVAKVSLLAGEQPISLHYEGDEGKPWKPCKSMRRVLVGVWGSDGNAYVGRSLTLYRDDSVTFGGQAVGGIRISHMSNIPSPVTMSLTATKKSKKPFTVKPLVVAASAPAVGAVELPPLTPDEIEAAMVEARKGTKALGVWWTGLRATPNAQRRFQEKLDELKKIAADIDAFAITDEPQQ